MVLVAGFSLATGHFFSLTTARSLANQAPDGLLLATGLTFVILTGGIDLSVGSVLGLAGAVFGVLIVQSQLPLPLAAAGAVATGSLCGLANGWVSGLVGSIDPLYSQTTTRGRWALTACQIQ